MVRKILLDSSYLLPLFNIDVDLSMPLGKLLEEHETMYFNPVSLVEIKWVLYKLVRKNKLSLREARENYINGLKLVLRDKRFRKTPLTTPRIERIADKLHDMGLNDYFDRIIGATAIALRLELVTDDRELREFITEYLEQREGKEGIGGV